MWFDSGTNHLDIGPHMCFRGAATQRWILEPAALQNGACAYRCISKKMHYKTPVSHNGYMESLEIYENYITLFCLEENKLFDKIILTHNHTWHITQSG